MIFVTVGAQMPFDRLVRAVDEWALRRGRHDAFAQIGPTDWHPRHIAWTKFLDQSEFREKVRAASAIVAHAGMGSIITAREMGKPILVMPRRGDLQETRNDHQVATARIFREFGWVAVAFDERELEARLDELSTLKVSGDLSPQASDRLISVLRSFISGADLPPPQAALSRVTPFQFASQPSASKSGLPRPQVEPVENSFRP